MSLSLLFHVNKYSKAIHLSFFELSNIHISICIPKGAFSIFLAVFKLTIVLSAITPFHFSIAFNLAFKKLSNVSFISILEKVSTNTVKQPIYKFAFIEGSITPHESAFAILLSIDELTFIGLSTIVPDLLALSVLSVIFPLSIVFTTVQILKHTLTISFIVSKLSDIEFSVCKNLSASAMHFIMLKLTFILWAIWPKHNSNTIL